MRTITIEKTLYKFDELNDKAKEKCLDSFRQHDDFEFHAECVIEDAKECAKLIGINISKVYYSGFSSQGDGACFLGNYAYAKNSVKAIKDHAPKDETLHRIATELAAIQKRYRYALIAQIVHKGRYYHAYSTEIDVSLSSDSSYASSVKTEDQDTVKELLRDYMNWVYKNLAQAYDYATSEECIKETIEANEYEFDENGRIA